MYKIQSDLNLNFNPYINKMKTQEINYSLGDQNFKAYVAHPELDKAPLILIAHTWA